MFLTSWPCARTTWDKAHTFRGSRDPYRVALGPRVINSSRYLSTRLFHFVSSLTSFLALITRFASMYPFSIVCYLSSCWYNFLSILVPSYASVLQGTRLHIFKHCDVVSKGTAKSS